MGVPFDTNPTQAPAPMPGQAESANLDQTISRMLSRMRPLSHLAPPGGMPQMPERSKPMTGPARTESEGTQLFMHNLGTVVQQAVAAHKEKQIRTAMADYSAIGTAWENAQMAAGDPSDPNYQQKTMQIFQQMPTVQAILGDPKKMKNIAKAFSQDWLNPEKTTVYGEALKRHMQADKAGKMMKLMQALHLKSKSQPQLDPQQRQQLVQEESQRLPFGAPGGGQTDAAQARLMNEMIQLQKSTQGTYTIQKVSTPDGDRLIAVNNKHPEEGGTPVEIMNKDGSSQPAVPMKTGALGKTGDIFSVNGKPYGVHLNGKTISVTDFASLKPNERAWAAQKLEEANLRWLEGQMAKEKVARIRGEMYNKGREYAVFDRQTGSFRMATPAELATGPDRFAPASQEQQAMGREGVFQDINFNLDNVDKAFAGLKHDFTPAQRAAIIAAFRSNDPGALDQFVGSTVMSNMSPDMQDVVATLKSANENILSLRYVGYSGSASDMLRHAIQDLLPTRGQSIDMSKRQMKLLHGTVNRLHRSIPNVQLPRPLPDEGGGVISDPNQIPN